MTMAALLLASTVSTTLGATPQIKSVKVSISPTTQKFLGDVSALDRDKFVGLHMLQKGEDDDFERFKRQYNLNPDYIGSRSFYYPLAKAKGGAIPKVQNKYNGVREVDEYIATGTAANIFFDKTLNYAEYDLSGHIKALTEYIASSYKNEWESVPRYLEPLNEPMVHAADFCKSVKGAERKEAVEAVITYICEYHRDLARAIKSTPELKNMQVMGFGSAFPEFEANNFGLWNNRFRQFIDVAGEDIDILSFHLYDGSGINNQGGRRTGSNLEAIMDILQTYSYIRLGKVLPMAITEYGRLVPNQPEWAAQTGAKGNNLAANAPKAKASNYHPVTNSQAVRSQLHMVMSFMNRQNEIVNTCPFTIGKAPQTAMYCKSSLWVKQEDGTYEYSNRRLFFEMMKDLKGDNVVINSDDIDLQTLAFVDGSELYVMLNNLEAETREVSLDIAGLQEVKSVEVKSLKIFEDREPELKTKSYKAAPQSVSLEYGETAVVTFKCKKPIKFTNKEVRTKYYSKDYLKVIKPNVANTFAFEGVPASAKGEAILRLGVGRAHEFNEVPDIVKINGTEVKITKDVVKGYDQATRKMFFGALEIPFDISLIKEGTNSVEVTFKEGAGHVTSAILQLQK